MAEPDKDGLLDAVTAIARKAGALAMASWAEGVPAADVWEKSPGQYVSPADLFVNALLREQLSALLPEAGWLSEETVESAAQLAKSLAWVVDPIDGTRDHVRGRRGWCVSVALVEDGVPVLGVLWAPALDELYVGERGTGAWCNGTAIRCSGRDHYSGARIPVDNLPRKIDLVAVPKPNSIALRIGLVAADRADLVVATRWGSEWDIAAAHCIAHEAGAMVTDALGQPLTYNASTGKALGVICCPPGMHAEAIERARPYLPEG